MAVVRRVARILDSVCAEPHPLSLTELSTRLGEPRSSVHRLLGELIDLGLVVRLDGVYAPGPRLSTWAQAALHGPDLAQVARPFLERLRDATGESVRLYVRDGDERVCVTALEGTFELRHVIQVGRRLPLHAGAAGKLLLAHADGACVARELERAASTPASPRAPSAERLREELEAIRQAGYALSVGEREEGLSAIAAAVHDHSGSVVAAVSVSGPSSRLTIDGLLAMRPLVGEAADTLSRALGGG